MKYNLMNNILIKIMNWFKKNFRLNSEHKEVPYEKSTTSIVLAGVENGWAGACPGALKDVMTMADVFRKTANNFDITMLLDKQATVKSFTSAVQNAVKKDLAIIFYSGHGGQDTSHSLGKANQEDDNINEFICLYDKPFLDDKIWNLISQSKGRVVCIWDCCHSATMFRTVNLGKKKTLDDFSGFKLRRQPQLMAATKDASGFSLWNLSGCPDNTYSYGSAVGGMLTNTISRYARDYLSYQDIWDKVSSNKELKRSEIVQKTELGKSFKNNLFAQ